MTKSEDLKSIELNLGTRLHKELAEEAEKNGYSLNEYILETVYRRIITKEVFAHFEDSIRMQTKINDTLTSALMLIEKLIVHLEKEKK